MYSCSYSEQSEESSSEDGIMQETLSTDSSNSDVDDEQSSEVDTSEDSSEEEIKVNCHIGGSCKGCKHVDQMLSTQHPPHPAKTSPYGWVPKRAMSGYLIYISHERELALKELGRSEMPALTEFTRQVAAKWNGLSANKRESFQKRSEHDKARYEHERAYYSQMGVACPDGAARSKKRAQRKKSRKCKL